ncbi:hypothetical protein ACP70R_019489 [Stipagrostis hirtigluma subsp. patula]
MANKEPKCDTVENVGEPEGEPGVKQQEQAEEQGA